MEFKYLGVLNRSKISDADLVVVLESVNQQVAEDFAPIWDLGYKCRLFRSSSEADLNCVHTVYVVDEADSVGSIAALPEDALYVVSTQVGDLAVTLAHQVLELIVDKHE